MSTSKADLYEQQRLAAGQAVRLHAALAARAGINITDVNVLAMLAKTGPMTAGQIAHEAGLSRGGAITAVIDRLQKAGYLHRRRDDDDRRKVIIELDPDGPYQVLTEAIGGFSAAYHALIDEYSADEVTLLLDFARRANELVAGYVTELQEG